MFDVIFMSLAVAMPDLSIVYWVCMCVGCGLLVFSMIGLAEGDASIDVDADVGGGYGDLTSLATWLSVRFLIYFVAVFGAVGIILTYMSDFGRLSALLISAGCGFVAGQGVHQVFRRLEQTSGNSAVTVGDYINKIGRVSIAVTDGRKGEVALRVRNSERFVPAIAKQSDATFNVGDEVVVVDYCGGVAGVVSREEFEFITNKNQGGES